MRLKYLCLKLNDPQLAIDNITKCIFKVASLQDFTISVGGSSISCSETARNLGAIFDSAMNLESHMFVKLLYMNLRKIRNVLTDQSAGPVNSCSYLISY